jgi:hypothetical protein
MAQFVPPTVESIPVSKTYPGYVAVSDVIRIIKQYEFEIERLGALNKEAVRQASRQRLMDALVKAELPEAKMTFDERFDEAFLESLMAQNAAKVLAFAERLKPKRKPRKTKALTD